MKDVMKKRVVGAVVLVIIGIALPLMLARCMQDEDSDTDAMRVYEIAPDGQARPAGAPADGGKSNVERDSVDGASGVAEKGEHDTPDLPEAVSPAASDENSAAASETPQLAAEPEPEPAGNAASESNYGAPKPSSEDDTSSLRQTKSLSGAYVVQVASFGDEANAERMARELSGEFKAFYRAGDVNGKTYYRVRIGPFENEKSANSAAAKLRSSGRATLVRRAE